MKQTEGIINRARSPECTVCIANYNGEAFLKGCLDSVLGQDCDFAVEIIVHDDASTDSSIQLIKENYPDVRLITSEQNVGFCESANRMVDMARGTYVLLLNNDAELLPGALSTLYEYSRNLGKPAILTLPQYDFDTGELVDRGNLVDVFMNPVPNLDPNRREVAMAIGACLWIPRRVWHELGGFPRWFESLAEDMYLCAVARIRGVVVHAVEGPGYRHRYGASFGGGKVVADKLKTTIRRRQLSERNKSYTMIICYPAPWLFVVMPLHFLLLLIEGLSLSLVKLDFGLWRNVYGNCVAEVWRNRVRLWMYRRTVQKRRVVGSMKFFSTTTLLPRKLVMLARYGLPDVR